MNLYPKLAIFSKTHQHQAAGPAFTHCWETLCRLSELLCCCPGWHTPGGQTPVQILGLGPSVAASCSGCGYLQDLNLLLHPQGPNSVIFQLHQQTGFCFRTLQAGDELGLLLFSTLQVVFSAWGVCFDVCCFYFKRLFDHILL